MRFSWFCALVVGSVFTIQTQADSDIQWGVTISSGMRPPPVVRHEPVPPPRPAFVWVQGYWGWNGNAYVWLPGRWEPARPGYVYVQPNWQQGPRGWELHQGGWHAQGPHHAERGHGRERGGPDNCPPGHRRKGEC